MTSAYADDPVEGLSADARTLALRGLVPLTVAAVYLVGYVVTIVVPYLVNGLHLLPLAEVAGGAHDPKDLWPRTSSWGDVPAVAAIVVLMTGPVVVLAALGWSVAALVARWSLPGRAARTVLVATVVLASAFLVTYFSPFGRALGLWTMD